MVAWMCKQAFKKNDWEGQRKNSRSPKMESQMFRGSHAIPLLLKCFHEMDI